MSKAIPFEKVGECLYRNPSSGSYYAIIKKSGKQIKRSLETDNLPEARRKLRVFRTDAETLDLGSRKLTLEKLADRYEKTIQHLSPGTIKNRATVLNLIRKEWPEGGSGRRVASIKSSEVQTLLSRYKNAAGYNLAREVLLGMFELAVEDGVIFKLPFDPKKLKPRKRETPIRLAPSPADFRAIVKSIRTQPFSDTAEESADFVEFLGLAGMGQAEASSLDWSRVDFQRSQFTTFRHKTRRGFEVPIYPQLRPLLERRWAAAVKKNGGKPPRPEMKVFSIGDAKKALASACVRLNLPAYSARAFRRMFITAAIERGVDVKVIAGWQGHSDGGKLILDTYSHVRPAHSDRMALLMADETSATTTKGQSQ